MAFRNDTVEEWKAEIIQGENLNYFYNNEKINKELVKKDIINLIEELNIKYINKEYSNKRKKIKTSLFLRLINIFGINVCICCRASNFNKGYTCIMECDPSNKKGKHPYNIRITEIIEIIIDEYYRGEIDSISIIEQWAFIKAIINDIYCFRDEYSERIIIKYLTLYYLGTYIFRGVNIHTFGWPLLVEKYISHYFSNFNHLILCLNDKHGISYDINRSIDFINKWT